MPPASIWLALALAGSALSAGQFDVPGINSRTVDTALKPRHTATGTVVNSVTGEPVRRAVVQLNGVGQVKSAFTGADGRFSIEGVPDGPLYISARKPGFFAESDISPPRSSGNLVNFNLATPELLIKLVPAARIEGRIVDSDGEPIENVAVEVLASGIIDGRKQWQSRGGGSSDENGDYEIDSLMPGTYLIRTGLHSPFAGYLNVLAANRQRQVYPPQFYPNASDQSSAQPLELQAGADARADFTLSPVAAFTVSGRVAGVQIGLLILCEDPDGGLISTGMLVNHQTSQFELHAIPPGSWKLVFTSNDGQGTTYYAEQAVNVNAADVGGLDLVLQPLASIPVHIVNATAGGAVQVQLHAQTSSFNQPRTFFAQPDPSGGSLRVEDVMPGKYTVAVQATGSTCVESVESGSTDLMQNDLTVLPGSPPPPIQVTLSDQCAHLSGTIASASEATIATLILVPEGSPLAPVTMQVGSKFQLQNIRPATYRVYAFSDITNLEYADPDALRSFPSQEVTLGAGQTSDVQLELISRNRQ